MRILRQVTLARGLRRIAELGERERAAVTRFLSHRAAEMPQYEHDVVQTEIEDAIEEKISHDVEVASVARQGARQRPVIDWVWANREWIVDLLVSRLVPKPA